MKSTARTILPFFIAILLVVGLLAFAACGTTNFDDLETDDDLTVGDDLTVSGDAITFDSVTFAKPSAITITGVLTNVIIIYSQQ
jgi:hypothetical protein